MSEGTEYKIEITADAGQAKSDIKDVTQNLDELKSLASTASSEVSATGGATQNLGSGADKASQDLNQLGRELDEAAASASKAKQSFDEVGSSAKGMGSASQSADGDLVKSARSALQPFSDLQSTIGRVTGGLLMLKGAWDVGWAAGSFVRGLTEANSQLEEIKLNAEDVRRVLEYNNNLIAKARASDVSNTISQGQSKLASANGLTDISETQSAYMSKLSNYQSTRDILSNQRNQYYSDFTTSAASGDTEGRKAAELQLLERDRQIAAIDAQIKSLEDAISQAATKMKQAISEGVSSTGSWDPINVNDFQSGGGLQPVGQSVPTVGNQGMSLKDFSNVNKQPTETEVPDLEGVKTSMEGLDSSSQKTAESAQAMQTSAEKSAQNNEQVAANLNTASQLLNQGQDGILNATGQLAQNQSDMLARISQLTADIGYLSARVNSLG